MYSGKLTNKSSIYNVNKNQTEKIGNLMIAFADDFRYKYLNLNITVMLFQTKYFHF